MQHKKIRMSNGKSRFLILRILGQGATLILLSGLLQSPAAAAGKDPKDSKAERRERQALHRMQQQLNEVQQQKSAVEEEKAGLESTLKKTQGETEALKRASSSAQASVSRLEKDVQSANKEKADLHAQLAEAQKRSEDLVGQKKQLEQDLKNTHVALSKQSEQRQLCETHNHKLYSLGRELVDWYSSKGPARAFLEAEPFTRLKSVEMENLLETYRDKLESERLQGGALKIHTDGILS
jgi:chromosome segregation ATPase